MKRLFIAINLPRDVKDQIAREIDKINANFRWIREENWHLTLVFLGDQPDEAITGILNSIKDTAQKFSDTEIELDKIILAPPNKSPRMIWLTSTKKTSGILGQIQNDLQDNLINNKVRFQPENRPYNTHITLARFQFLPQNFQLPNYPITQLSNFTAESLDLMESKLKRTGAEYEILTKIAFLEQAC